MKKAIRQPGTYRAARRNFILRGVRGTWTTRCYFRHRGVIKHRPYECRSWDWRIGGRRERDIFKAGGLPALLEAIGVR